MVGSQARILYCNEVGRVAIAMAFNKAIQDGRIKVRAILHVHMPCVQCISVHVHVHMLEVCVCVYSLYMYVCVTVFACV